MNFSVRYYIWDVLVWSIAALFIAIPSTIQLSVLEPLFSIPTVILFELSCLYPWILFTPLLHWVIHQIPEGPSSKLQLALTHLGFAGVFFLIHGLNQSFMVAVFFNEAFSWTYALRDLFQFLEMRIIIYLGLAAFIHTYELRHKLAEYDLKKVRLETELLDARLKQVRTQLQPTFLVKVLESIRDSIDRSEHDAEQLIVKLSEMLRHLLKNVDARTYPLEDEIQFISNYLACQQIRRGYNFEFSILKSGLTEDTHFVSLLYLIPCFEMLLEEGEISGSISTLRLEFEIGESFDWSLKIGLSESLEPFQISNWKHNTEQALTKFMQAIRLKTKKTAQVKLNIEQKQLQINVLAPLSKLDSETVEDRVDTF